MKPVLLRWFARHAHRLPVTLLLTAALLTALAAPLLFFGCAGPGREPPALVQPRLVASTTFLGDALLVKVTLEPAGGGANARGPAGRPGGGGHRPHGPGGPEGEPPGEMDRGAAIAFAAPSAPTVRLHVAVTNQSSDTLAFAITDVISELGNFAIRPERLSLAPHQTAEIDPLGAAYPAAITELSVEVRLRHHGATESRTVRLKAAPAAP